MAEKPKREKGKRWGKERIDTRNWSKYNLELVARGHFLLDLDWVRSWEVEVAEMNAGKRGAPYIFPESLIRLQAVWNQWVGVRQIKGITQKLVESSQLPDFNDYSTINRRINKLEIEFDLPKKGSCYTSTDGSGIKIHNAGEYRQIKYGAKKKRWIEVVITADPFEKDILCVEVNLDNEDISEPDTAIKHIKHLRNNEVEIKKFWGDGAFDKRALFNELEKHKIPCAIPPRDNASNKAKGSMRRAREVKEYKDKTWNEWAKDKEYGIRWLGTEGIFSSVKGMFGEHTKSKNLENACQEAKRKFWIYQRMKNYAQT